MMSDFDTTIDNVEHTEQIKKSAIVNTDEGDNEKSLAQQGTSRHFSDLTADDQPIIPHKDFDEYEDVYYPTKTEPRCTICTSPLRTLIEHVYLDLGQSPYRVQQFFKTHYQAHITFESIKRHMETHCDLSQIYKPGLISIEHSLPSVENWFFREKQLVIAGLLQEIDIIRMLADNKKVASSASMRLKYSEMLSKLYKQLHAASKERDEEANTLSIQGLMGTLKEAIQKIEDEPAKQIILQALNDYLK